MSCYVYVLGSAGTDGARSYVGWTTDLDARLARHNDGSGARTTRGRHWRLLYAERFATRGEAMSREWRLKRDRRFRAALLADCLDHAAAPPQPARGAAALARFSVG